jgi:deoxyadenosine/deoxycytidine kinase
MRKIIQIDLKIIITKCIMTVYIFSVDGNIGSGKSTFIKRLSKYLKNIHNLPIIYLQEPVQDWKGIKHDDNKNLIEKYYEDQEKWGFSFQITTLISRISQIKNTIANNYDCIIITERSICSDKNVFCQMLYDTNVINTLNYNIYLRWFNEFIKDYPINGYIYIKTKPEKALERVLKRKRKGEEEIPIEYLSLCNVYHNNWLKKEEKLLELDGNLDIDDIPSEWVQNVKSFISQFLPPEVDPFELEFIMSHPFF